MPCASYLFISLIRDLGLHSDTISPKDEDGRTPLIIAAENGDVETMQTIMQDKSVDIFAKTKVGDLRSSQCCDVVKLSDNLILEFHLVLRVQKGHNAFHRAAIKGCVEAAILLADRKGSEIVVSQDSVSVRPSISGGGEGGKGSFVMGIHGKTP